MSSVQELRAAMAPSTASPNAGKPAAAAKPAASGKPAAGDRPAKSGASSAKSLSSPVGLLVLAGAFGLCAGIVLDRVVLPHNTAPPAPVEAVAAPQTGAEETVRATGTFIQPDANNPLQRGSGGVSVGEGDVVLGNDFAVTPGPDYRVLLVPKPAIRAASDIANTMYVDLGPLTAFQGSQHFAVPAGVDLSRYPSVVIWCRTYGSLISTADLSFQGG